MRTMSDGTIVVDTAKEAGQAVVQNHWIKLHITDVREDEKFTRQYKAVDWSQEGDVHYTRR